MESVQGAAAFAEIDKKINKGASHLKAGFALECDAFCFWYFALSKSLWMSKMCLKFDIIFELC